MRVAAANVGGGAQGVISKRAARIRGGDGEGLRDLFGRHRMQIHTEGAAEERGALVLQQRVHTVGQARANEGDVALIAHEVLDRSGQAVELVEVGGLQLVEGDEDASAGDCVGEFA